MNGKNKGRVESLCLTALGIALYVALSMMVKIPVVGHISLDLGYIVLGVYCWFYGPVAGAIVGAVGCSMVSILASGWFPPGWCLANLLIGATCGYVWNARVADLRADLGDYLVAIFSVFAGVGLIKTGVECALYGITVAVKLPKNMVAAVMDMITLCVGLFVAQLIEVRLSGERHG